MTKQVDLEQIKQGVRLILEGIGEDLDRAGLQETPQRVAEMYAELTSGMREDPTQHVREVGILTRSGAVTHALCRHLWNRPILTAYRRDDCGTRGRK